MLIDNFDRTTLNVAATKSAGNPEIAGDYGDPCPWLENGTVYLFCRNQTNGNIVVFTSSDLESWSSETAVLSPGTAGAWDDYAIEGPSIAKANGLYYLFYGGQVNTGGSGTTWKVGFATAKAIMGPYTKFSGNPIITRAGEGVNDCAVYYDELVSPPWQVFATAGSSGNKDDVSDGDFARFTALFPEGTWTDQGDVLTGIAQDESVVVDGEHLLMPYTPQFGLAVVQAVSNDLGKTFQAALSGNILDRVASSWENTIFAPHFLKFGSGWAIAYQGVNTASQIGIATIPRLHRWFPTAADAFEMPSSYLHTLTPASLAWNCCQSEYPYHPKSSGYTVQCDVYGESQADTGIFTNGLVVAQSASLYYSVLVNPSGPNISLVSGPAINNPSTVVIQSITSISIGLGVWRTIRARVTPTSIIVDWFNGTSWVTNILKAADLTLIPARTGPIAYSPTGNQSRFRKYSIGSSEPMMALETFTHVDRGNDISADQKWTTWKGSGFDIVSNQAKGLGSISSEAMCRLEVPLDLSQEISIEATIVTFTQPTAGKFAEARLYLQKDSGTQTTFYTFVARRDGGSTNAWFMYKLIDGTATQIGYVSLAVVNGDVMKMTWNPATNTIKGFVNGIERISAVDATLIDKPYGGIGFQTDDTSGVVIMDTVFCGPMLRRDAALETFTHADQSGDLSADHPWAAVGTAAWGIVSNQAKAIGSYSDAFTRMERTPDLSPSIIVQAKVISHTGGAGWMSSGLFLQYLPGGENLCGYLWSATSAGVVQLRRFTNGAPTTLQQVTYSIQGSDVLKLIVDVVTGTIKGYINGVEWASGIDMTYAKNFRAGLYFSSDNASGAAIFDLFSVSPVRAHDALSKVLIRAA